MEKIIIKYAFLFSIFITKVLISQSVMFYDSLAFFEREKITTFKVKHTINSKVIKTTTIKFEKNTLNLYLENQLVGENINIDTSQFINGLAVSNPASIFFFDSKNRIYKVTETLNNKINTKLFFYTDTISKRLRMIVNEINDEYFQTHVYLYKNHKLVKVIETFYSLLNQEGKRVWERTYNYEYDLNNRIRIERIIQNGRQDYINQFCY